MPAATRYLGYLLLSTLALLCVVALGNSLIDPYGIFRLIDRDGFNRIKSQAGQRAEMFKRHGAERTRPNTLILGNSRAEIAFDPESPAWPPAMRPVFNFALAGAGVDSALSAFTQVLEHTTPKVVVVGLDFLDFRVDPKAPDGLAPAQPDWSQGFRERLSALLTVSALADSIATVKAQRDPYPPSLTDAGFNPMRDYLGIARRDGYDAIFRQKDQEYAKSYARGPRSIYRADGRPGPEFRSLEKLIEIANAHGTQLRLVIYPLHAHALVLFHHAGLWPAFEAWKRELVAIVDNAASNRGVELWDFSGFSRYAVEKVPPPDDKTGEVRWYWEAGHFKKSLGDVLLAQLIDPRPGSVDWGLRLTADNVEEHLRRQRAARDSYETSNADEWSVLAGLVAKATADSGNSHGPK